MTTYGQATIFQGNICMYAREINERLVDAGLSQSAIANVLGCSPSLLSKVINRKATSTRIAKAVAKILQLPVLQVFPDYESHLKQNRYSLEEAEKKVRLLLNFDSVDSVE